MLSVTNPLANTFKPYMVSPANNPSGAQQPMNQSTNSWANQASNMPLYMQNMYGLHGYIAQQQQQQLLSVDPQHSGYGNDPASTTPPRSDDKDGLPYNVQALLSGTTLHGLMNGSTGSKASSGPLSSGSMTSSGEQARSTPSLNSECSNSLGSGLNTETPSGGSSAETDMTGSAKKRTHSGQIKSGDRDKDSAYWEKRRKNNESARRSRESRRNKEEQIAMRVVYLEQENLQLRTEVSLLRGEIDKLRCMLYNS